MAITDYGDPTDPLASPSLSAWAASVAAALAAADSWTGWTPSPTGATYSSVSAMSCKRGQLVTCVVKGVVSTVTGDITFAAPYPAETNQVGGAVGTARLLCAGGTYFAHVMMSGAATFTIRIAGTNGVAVVVSPTVPATWTAGNTIQFNATYRST